MTDRGRAVAAVRVESVHAGYGRRTRSRPAVEDVSFALAGPGVTALVGANGAGKSTVIRVVLGLMPPWRGTVLLNGRPPSRYRREAGIAYVPETVVLPRGWTVGEFLREGAALSGVPLPERRRATGAALEEVGLEVRREERVERLSKGSARRLALAFALLGRPSFVVLDEPWSGLDPPSRLRLREEVRRLGASGHTVLVASHELGEVAAVADRCLALDGGRLWADFDAPDVDRLERLFSGHGPWG